MEDVPSPPSDSEIIPVEVKDRSEELEHEFDLVMVIDDDQLRDIQRARDNHKRLQRKRRRYVPTPFPTPPSPY